MRHWATALGGCLQRLSGGRQRQQRGDPLHQVQDGPRHLAQGGVAIGEATRPLGIVDVEPGSRGVNRYRLSRRWSAITKAEAVRLSISARAPLPCAGLRRGGSQSSRTPVKVIEPVEPVEFSPPPEVRTPSHADAALARCAIGGPHILTRHAALRDDEQHDQPSRAGTAAAVDSVLGPEARTRRTYARCGS